LNSEGAKPAETSPESASTVDSIDPILLTMSSFRRGCSSTLGAGI